MADDVQQAHISRQVCFTPGDMEPCREGVHHTYMPKKTVTPNLKAPRRRTFLREWRLSKEKTLEQVAPELGLTHASLSRIERGVQPYNQDLLEALAGIYGCTPADLLMRDPSQPESIWSIWDQAKSGQQRQDIIEHAKVIVRKAG